MYQTTITFLPIKDSGRALVYTGCFHNMQDFYDRFRSQFGQMNAAPFRDIPQRIDEYEESITSGEEFKGLSFSGTSPLANEIRVDIEWYEMPTIGSFAQVISEADIEAERERCRLLEIESLRSSNHE